MHILSNREYYQLSITQGITIRNFAHIKLAIVRTCWLQDLRHTTICFLVWRFPATASNLNHVLVNWDIHVACKLYFHFCLKQVTCYLIILKVGVKIPNMSNEMKKKNGFKGIKHHNYNQANNRIRLLSVCDPQLLEFRKHMSFQL